MNPDDLDKLHSRRDYLAEWLDRHKKAQDVVPSVQRDLEITEWEMEAIENRPHGAERVPLPDLSAKIEQENEFIKHAVPMIPNYSRTILLDATAVATSSSSVVYAFVSQVQTIGTPEAVNYSKTYSAKYQALQSTHNRSDEVRTLISCLTTQNTLERFDRAARAYDAGRAGTMERTAVANEIRNLLHAIKGDLFKKARHQAKENMTWGKMSDRLAKSGPGSTEHRQVLDQETTHAQLIDQLSGILKDMDRTSITDLSDIWTRVLDHLFVTLSLVNT